jgi:hypothetical protein
MVTGRFLSCQAPGGMNNRRRSSKTTNGQRNAKIDPGGRACGSISDGGLRHSRRCRPRHLGRCQPRIRMVQLEGDDSCAQICGLPRNFWPTVARQAEAALAQKAQAQCKVLSFPLILPKKRHSGVASLLARDAVSLPGATVREKTARRKAVSRKSRLAPRHFLSENIPGERLSHSESCRGQRPRLQTPAFKRHQTFPPTPRLALGRHARCHSIRGVSYQLLKILA